MKIGFLMLFVVFYAMGQSDTLEVFPTVITDSVSVDSDDPAIYKYGKKTLILGTDKGGNTGKGGVFVYDLKGKNIKEKNIVNLNRPNNIDITYGLKSPINTIIDIAVCTERFANKIRVIKLPQMELIDNGGIPVFEDQAERSPMGIALFTDKSTKNIYAIVGRKSGPGEGYLYQYLLKADSSGNVAGTLVRKFGKYSGIKEIESIAVDNELGYVYYSDENVGIRKYYAHPDSSNSELALFGMSGFKEDHEGISIYKSSKGKGFILVSDQQANQFHVFRREGEAGNIHNHTIIRTIKTQTKESDGNEITNIKMGRKYRSGLFVAMTNTKQFHYYSIEKFFKGL